MCKIECKEVHQNLMSVTQDQTQIDEARDKLTALHDRLQLIRDLAEDKLPAQVTAQVELPVWFEHWKLKRHLELREGIQPGNRLK